MHLIQALHNFPSLEQGKLSLLEYIEKAHGIRDALGDKFDTPVADKIIQGLNDRMIKMAV
jgi:hypothetical protein